MLARFRRARYINADFSGGYAERTITPWNALRRWQGLVLRLGVLVLAAAILGLPIDTLFKYVLLLAIALPMFVGSVATSVLRWIAAAIVVGLVVAGHALLPAPRIEEGFNVFLPGPGVEQSSKLPTDVLRVLTAQFNTQYSPGGAFAITKLSSVNARTGRRSPMDSPFRRTRFTISPSSLVAF